MFPEIGYAEDAVCADESPCQALRLIGIARDDFHTERGERLGLFRIGLAGIARTVNGLSRSARIARTNPPPCAPVAPIIAMISFLALLTLLGMLVAYAFWHLLAMPKPFRAIRPRSADRDAMKECWHSESTGKKTRVEPYSIQNGLE